MQYILDENKKAVPCEDTFKWGQWMETRYQRIVSRTEKDGLLVSTVFLGIDHSIDPKILLIFETMVFYDEDDPGRDLVCRRYSTWEEAEKGHQEVCASVFGDRQNKI